MSPELNDTECEKGQITQRPPVPYAVSNSGLLMMTTRETIKIKTPEGERKQAVLGDGTDAEEYVKHLMAFDQFMEKKGHRADLEKAAKAVLSKGLTLMKHSKVPKGEKDPAKAERLTKVEAAKKELIEAKVVVGVALVKPTTSYFWFFVTFRHNRICSLAVAFKNYFLGCLPALLKIIPKLASCTQMPIM